MAPGLVDAGEGRAGKLPTDVWWHTIVPTNGHEKTGYPTQKPEGIVRRMVAASTRPGDWCLDFFAGSGTLGAVAARARPPLRADRLQPRGDRDHAHAPLPRRTGRGRVRTSRRDMRPCRMFHVELRQFPHKTH